ncbi:hypothetical protein FD755_021839 [Muntiacus reevesi]|uniref:Fibronectin type-III domain-containing protein n=1 Tax=Muntiacus reevesi TaxID=9886 RepID=A0A5N3W1H5_MUNRE|nr:hypothetical protein FD755_021839 [Muntiacus reevesi]
MVLSCGLNNTLACCGKLWPNVLKHLNKLSVTFLEKESSRCMYNYGWFALLSRIPSLCLLAPPPCHHIPHGYLCFECQCSLQLMIMTKNVSSYFFPLPYLLSPHFPDLINYNHFSKFAGILSAALSHHPLLGFEIALLELHHLHYFSIFDCKEYNQSDFNIDHLLIPWFLPFYSYIPKNIFLFAIMIAYSKESACNVGDPDSIPRSGISPEEGNGHPLQYLSGEFHEQRSLADCTYHASLVFQTRKSSCSTRILLPGLGRSPGEEKGYPLQYSGLENSMSSKDRGSPSLNLYELKYQNSFFPNFKIREDFTFPYIGLYKIFSRATLRSADSIPLSGPSGSASAEESAQHATGDQWRNNCRKNEEMEPKQKQHPNDLCSFPRQTIQYHSNPNLCPNQKTSTSVLLTMPKPLTVWITKQKFLNLLPSGRFFTNEPPGKPFTTESPGGPQKVEPSPERDFTLLSPTPVVSPTQKGCADSLTQFCSETCSCKLYVLPQNRTSKKIWVKVDCFRTSESVTHRHFSVESILCHPTATCRILYFFKKTCTRRPPLPPRPMPPRRKPLPPNNVTGKPGSAGIISSGRVTSPPLRATLRPTEAPLETMETDKKPPTVPASEEDLDNMTDFSSSPTRETDPLGKPRFKGPHVRYIQKPDDSPCSITDSVKRFPKEEATEGNATSPPQNPPTNLTVVTVEGCPSFVILDWDKPLNDTVTEYEVISRENGSFSGKNKSIQTTNQTFSTVENLKPDTRVSEPVSAGRDAIWTERPFNSDSYSECQGKQYVKRTWYKKFVGVQLCNSLRYKIYLSDSLTGKFYNIGDQRGHGEDHCQFVDSFLDGRTGQQLSSDQLPTKEGYFRAVRQEPVQFGEIGGHTQINYVQWYECGTTIPGKW